MSSISISNLAWAHDNDEEVYMILKKYNIKMIDLVLSKYFKIDDSFSIKKFDNIRDFWFSRDIEIIGMQSILFGKNKFNLFSKENLRDEMLDYLQKMFHIAKHLKIKKIVFGSPKNRDRSGLNNNEVKKIYLEFFRRVGDICQKNNLIFCLEPNPECYGSNFMVNSTETAEVVKNVNHPNIKMQLDTGSIIINDADPYYICSNFKDIIGHIHISEPFLKEVKASHDIHKHCSKAISEFLPDLPKTIEMLPKQNSKNLSYIETSIKNVISCYSR